MPEFLSPSETLRVYRLANTLIKCAEEGVDYVLRPSDLEYVILSLLVAVRSSEHGDLVMTVAAELE